jgi:hypothetical protein
MMGLQNEEIAMTKVGDLEAEHRGSYRFKR